MRFCLMQNWIIVATNKYFFLAKEYFIPAKEAKRGKFSRTRLFGINGNQT